MLLISSTNMFYATDLRVSIISWLGVSKDCAISRAVWPVKESQLYDLLLSFRTWVDLTGVYPLVFCEHLQYLYIVVHHSQVQAGQAPRDAPLSRDEVRWAGEQATGTETYLRFGSVAGSDSIIETISFEHLATARVRGVEPSFPLTIIYVYCIMYISPFHDVKLPQYSGWFLDEQSAFWQYQICPSQLPGWGEHGLRGREQTKITWKVLIQYFVLLPSCLGPQPLDQDTPQSW